MVQPIADKMVSSRYNNKSRQHTRSTSFARIRSACKDCGYPLTLATGEGLPSLSERLSTVGRSPCQEHTKISQRYVQIRPVHRDGFVPQTLNTSCASSEPVPLALIRAALPRDLLDDDVDPDFDDEFDDDFAFACLFRGVSFSLMRTGGAGGRWKTAGPARCLGCFSANGRRFSLMLLPMDDDSTKCCWIRMGGVYSLKRSLSSYNLIKKNRT